MIFANIFNLLRLARLHCSRRYTISTARRFDRRGGVVGVENGKRKVVIFVGAPHGRVAGRYVSVLEPKFSAAIYYDGSVVSCHVVVQPNYVSPTPSDKRFEAVDNPPRFVEVFGRIKVVHAMHCMGVTFGPQT